MRKTQCRAVGTCGLLGRNSPAQPCLLPPEKSHGASLEPSWCQGTVPGCLTVLAVPPAVTSQLPGAAPWLHKNLPLKVLPTLSRNKATFSHWEMNKQGKKPKNLLGIPEQLVWHCWALSLCPLGSALAPSVTAGWYLNTPNWASQTEHPTF